MPIIGIAGTAKNTGKTTTLNALLQHAHRHTLGADNTQPLSFRADEGGEKSASPQHTQPRFLTEFTLSGANVFGMTIGVTSIGYDGEEIDNITSLPKPRIFLHRGMIASTSARCVPDSGWSLIHNTGLFNALDEIVIVRCETPGLIVLAGPNKRSELETVVRLMEGFGGSNIFVDGSLNRIAPMSVVDKIIFTTGAARTTDIPALVEEMKAIEFFFQFGKSQWSDKNTSSTSVILSEANPPVGQAGNPVFIEKFITSSELRILVKSIQRMPDEDRPHEIIFNDPISLLLSGEPQRTAQHIAQLIGLGITISYQKPIHLAAVIVNPFYPEYRDTTYAPAYVDATLLLSTANKSLKTPVFDLNECDALELYSVLV